MNAEREEFCTCCERKLNPEKTVMLALDCGSGLYSKGGTPELESQGWFPFGAACARKVLKNGGEVA